VRVIGCTRGQRLNTVYIWWAGPRK